MIVTVAPSRKPVPVIVTVVPPPMGPDDGSIASTEGAVPYVKPPARVPVTPSEVVRTTSPAPAVVASPVMAVTTPSLTLWMLAATPAMDTSVTSPNCDPVMVTSVSPLSGPEVGEIEAIDGPEPYV